MSSFVGRLVCRWCGPWAKAGELCALHGFIKKANKTPASDLEFARKRQKEVENG